MKKMRQLKVKIKSSLLPVPWRKQQHNSVSWNRRLSKLKWCRHLNRLCWIIHIDLVHQNLSCFRPCLVIVKLARNFLWARQKYVIIFMLLRHTLEPCLLTVPFYNLSFDESYNNVLKKEQLDLHVRYFKILKIML